MPGFQDIGSEREQAVRLAPFLDLGSESTVRAAGALLRHLDTALPAGLEAGAGQGNVLFLGSLVIKKILTVDEATATCLQL